MKNLIIAIGMREDSPLAYLLLRISLCKDFSLRSKDSSSLSECTKGQMELQPLIHLKKLILLVAGHGQLFFVCHGEGRARSVQVDNMV